MGENEAKTKGLKLNQWKKHWPAIVWGVIGLLIIGFFARVAIWEADYYNSKTGSEREVATTQQIDETPVTEKQKAEYTVAPDRPRYLSTERLGLKNARVLAVGINEKGEMGTPNNNSDVGWYYNSGKPGQGGTMVIDGHNGGPTVSGIFKHLPTMQENDMIVIERGDGTLFKYKVKENETIPLNQANAYMFNKAQSSPEPGKESLTLISCTGEWSQKQQTYLSRVFIRAVITE